MKHKGLSKLSGQGAREAAKGYILVAPAILLLTVFTIYPIFYLVHSSFYDGSIISKERNYVGLSHYRKLFGNVDFQKTMSNTVVYSFLLVGILMVLATLFAVWINGKTQRRLNAITQAAVFTPHIISLVSISTVFLWLMDPQIGVINYVLRWFGLSFPFLTSSKTALFSLVLIMVWKGLGYYSLLILAALQTIPPEIYEAAELDDSPKVKVFFRITLPMISPTLFFTAIVATIGSFQVFETVNLMTQGGPVNSTNTLVYYIYEYAFKYMKLGEASAAGVVLLVFVGILTVLYFAVLSRRVHYQ